MGRTNDPLGLCSSSCDTTTAQPCCWPGDVVATPAPARNVWQQAAHAQLKVVRIWPSEERTWALELQSAIASPRNQTGLEVALSGSETSIAVFH